MPDTITEEGLVEDVRALTVVSEMNVACDGDYEIAGDILKEFKAKETQVREFFKPHIAAAHAAHKGLTTRLNEIVGPLSDARKVIGGEMGRYQAKLEAQRKQDEEIRAAQQKEAEEKAAKTADTLEEQGEHEMAKSARNNVPAVQSKAESAPPKVAGTRRTTVWSYEITDPSAIPREYLCPDEKVIGAIVRTRKGDTSIAGVRVFSETKVT